jgi:hypothetical protein
LFKERLEKIDTNGRNVCLRFCLKQLAMEAEHDIFIYILY